MLLSMVSNILIILPNNNEGCDDVNSSDFDSGDDDDNIFIDVENVSKGLNDNEGCNNGNNNNFHDYHDDVLLLPSFWSFTIGPYITTADPK